MTLKPAISVIIPAHNCSKTIHRSIFSLSKQTFNDFEVIIVENGSTDETYTVAQKLLKENTNIKYLVIKSLDYPSVSQARNVGIEISRGDYLFFLDADDSISPETLSVLYEAMKKSSADIVYCPFDRIRGRRVYKFEKMYDYKLSSETTFDNFQFIRLFLEGRTWIRIGNCLLRNSIAKLNNLAFPDGFQAGEDQYFFLKYLLYSRKILYIDKGRMFYYDDNPNSLANSVRVFDAVKVYEIFAKEIESMIIKLKHDSYRYSDMHEIINVIYNFKLPYLYLRGLYRVAKNSTYKEFLMWKTKILTGTFQKTMDKANLSDLPNTKLGKFVRFGTIILTRFPYIYYLASKYLI